MRKKNLKFQKKIIMLIMLFSISLFSYNNLKADIIQVPQVLGTDWGYYGVYDDYYYGNDCEHLLTVDELSASGMSAGLISEIHVQASNDMLSGARAFCIHMMNSSATTLTNRTPVASMTEVFSAPDVNGMAYFGATGTNLQWVVIPLDTPFEYTGGALHIRFCNFSPPGYSSPYTYYHGRKNMTDRTLGVYTSNSNPGWSCAAVNTANITTISHGTGSLNLLLPNFRFEIDMVDHDTIQSQYKQASVTQVTNPDIYYGTPNIPILQLQVNIRGNLPPKQQFDSVVFSGKSSVGKISKAKLYYSGTESKFDISTATLLQEFNFNNVTNTDVFNFNQFTPIVFAEHGIYNFWLVYDLSSSYSTGSVDGKFESMYLSNGTTPTIIDPAVTTPDPAGVVNINNYYQVGNGTATSPGYLHPVGNTNYGNGACGYMLTQAELAAVGITEGTINELGIYFISVPTYSISGGQGSTTMGVYLMNCPPGTNAIPLLTPASITALTQVYYVPTNFQWTTTLGATADNWCMIPFSDDFEYTGGDLFIVFYNHTLGGNNRGNPASTLQGTASTVRNIMGYGDTGNWPGGANGGFSTCYGSFTNGWNTSGSASAPSTSYNFMPNFRFDWSGKGIDNIAVLPGNNSSFMKGDLLNSSHPQYIAATPSFSFDMAKLDNATWQNEVRYEIIGPEPLTTVVYTMVDPNNPGNPFIRITKNDGTGSEFTFSYDVQRATGPYVWSTGAGADNKSLDLRNINIVKAGRYKTRLTVQTLSGLPQHATPTVFENYFDVRANNNLVAHSIISPDYMKDYPFTAANGIDISYSVMNGGMTPIKGFESRVIIYEVEYDAATGSVISETPIDTLPKDDAGNPYPVVWPDYGMDIELLTGQNVVFGDLHLDPWIPPHFGYYAFKVEAWYPEGSNIEDQEPFDNVFPREGDYWLIRAQYEVDPCVEKVFTEPIATTFRLGEKVTIYSEIINDGLVDVAPTDSLFLRTYVKDLTSGAIVFESIYQVNQAGTNAGPVRIYCVDDATGELAQWEVNYTGQFQIFTELYQWPIGGTGTVFKTDCFAFSQPLSVHEALSGTYRVGQNERIKTIRAAIDSLYRYGVKGPVEFQLMDAEYNESSEGLIAANPGRFTDAPALEFRGRIFGANASNPIRFVPSFQRQNSRASIQINLTSRTGIGMHFGSTNDSVANVYALVNEQSRADKNKWVFSESHITWDGGPNRSFKITYKAPAWGTPQFRAPIYMNNASNVTIKNCIIEDGIFQEPSHQYLLPGNTYNNNDLQWLSDYNSNTLADPNFPSRTYSAGVVIRTTPPYQERYQENFFRLDTVVSHNITISNNEITKFTYGVVDLGLNYRLVSYPFLVDIKDTLFGYTRMDMENDANFMLGGTIMLNNNPANNDTVIYVYRDNRQTTTRSYTYYKLYNIYTPTNFDNILDSYTMVVDSANGGVTRCLNYNNVIEDNQIYEIYRAGIFVGNSENTTISGNRIHGITGQVVDEFGVRQDDIIDCAGILLGGRQRDYTTGIDGFFNLNLEVYKNEISNVASNKSAAGIKYEQTATTEKITAQDYLFPDAYDRTKIYSNIIWGITANTNHTDRYGIKIFPAKRDRTLADDIWVPSDTLYYSTMLPSYFMTDLLIANNTIIMDADAFSSSIGDYIGLYIQNAKNTRIMNNALELLDSTFGYASNSNKFASAVFYQGPLVDESNTTIDYNDYAYPDYVDSPVDAYRYVNTDVSGVVLDIGYRGEFQNLRQWQNLMRTDYYSSTAKFANDLVKTDELLPKLRMRTDPPVMNSPLEKQGTYLIEASTDIDGVDRTVADQRLDIGAQYIEGRRANTDLEVLNIYEPATYQYVRGPFRDAEYFMIDNKPVTVNVLIRNNGNGDLYNRAIRLRVYEESSKDNDSVAAIHNKNYNETYYNKESAHYNDRSEFPDLEASTPIFFEMTQYVDVAPGEGVFVEFPMDKIFNTYWELNQISNSYKIPVQFSTMYSNVTPRYRFEVVADLTADEKQSNNSYSKYARFFVKKSQRNMLICAYNTYNTIDTLIGGNLVHYDKVTNADFVAGALNLDTLVGAFRKLAIYQADAGESPVHDFDVLDRKAWDYRNYDLSLYKTVYVSDELAIDTTFWISNGYDFTQRYFQDKYFTNNLVKFVKHTKLGEKHNLIIGSENFISDIYKNYPFLELNQPAKLDLVKNYLRVDVFLDELRDEVTNDLITTFHRTPLYEIRSVMVGLPPVATYIYAPLEYKFNNRPGTITGRSLGNGMEYIIKPTDWSLTSDINRLTDRVPFGILYKPIDNMIGFSSIGNIYDTLTSNMAMTDILEYNKVSTLAISTQLNNIILLGFDWRHYQNLERLLISIDNFLEANGGVGGPDDPILPLTLGEFDVQPVGKRVDMAWRTASEHNIQHFEVQRSDFNNKDNIFGAFKTIDIVETKDDNYDNSYSNVDKEVAFGKTYYYRLKLVDFNGNFNYSEVRSATIENASFAVSEINPNPVTGTSNVSIDISNEQNIYAAIYDLTGRELLIIADGSYGSGRYTFEINSDKLTSGSYTLVIRNSNGDIINKTFNVVK